jgi:acetoacetyl-CoA synthetase
MDVPSALNRSLRLQGIFLQNGARMETSLHTIDDTASSLVELRSGATATPLFLFSGGDGDPRGLFPLAARIQNHRASVGVVFCQPDKDGRLPRSIEVMAERSYSAIRAFQPRGPYHLVGYSFGGLVAIEVAKLLREANEEIALLGLIDTLFDQRFWPTPLFLRSQIQVIGRHFRIILGLPFNEMIQTLFSRSRNLFVRLIRKQMPAVMTMPSQKAKAASHTEQHCKTLMSNYRPTSYSGRLTCFDAYNHDDYGCHPVELWQPIAKEIECSTIPGDHTSILTDQVNLARLAAAIDLKLETVSARKQEVP